MKAIVSPREKNSSKYGVTEMIHTLFLIYTLTLPFCNAPHSNPTVAHAFASDALALRPLSVAPGQVIPYRGPTIIKALVEELISENGYYDFTFSSDRILWLHEKGIMEWYADGQRHVKVRPWSLEREFRPKYFLMVIQTYANLVEREIDDIYRVINWAGFFLINTDRHTPMIFKAGFSEKMIKIWYGFHIYRKGWHHGAASDKSKFVKKPIQGNGPLAAVPKKQRGSFYMGGKFFGAIYNMLVHEATRGGYRMTGPHYVLLVRPMSWLWVKTLDGRICARMRGMLEEAPFPNRLFTFILHQAPLPVKSLHWFMAEEAWRTLRYGGYLICPWHPALERQLLETGFRYVHQRAGLYMIYQKVSQKEAFRHRLKYYSPAPDDVDIPTHTTEEGTDGKHHQQNREALSRSA